VIVDPLGNVVSSLPVPDTPDLPGWADWLKLGLVFVLIVLGVAGALARRAR
jgi:hypothetical protein